jgi:hypothetical protein
MVFLFVRMPVRCANTLPSSTVLANTARRRALKSAVSKVNLVSQARGALRTMSHSEALQSLVISPNNRFKEFFDWVVVGLVLYTTVNVPLVVAYPPPLYESSFGLEVFNVIVDFVFVVDIILNFFTGYVELANGHNTIQTRPSRIRRHYLRGALLPIACCGQCRQPQLGMFVSPLPRCLILSLSQVTLVSIYWRRFHSS